MESERPEDQSGMLLAEPTATKLLPQLSTYHEAFID